MTQDLIRRILDSNAGNFCQVTVTTPLPGTPLWEHAVRKGLDPDAIDWRQFSLSPLVSNRGDFYVNEHIPFQEFKRLVDETARLGNSRRLEAIIGRMNWRYAWRAIRSPTLALKIVGDYLRHRCFVHASNRHAPDASPESPSSADGTE